MFGLFGPLLLALAATAVVALIGGRLRPHHGAWMTAGTIGIVIATVLITSWTVTLGYLAHEPLVGELFVWCREHFGSHEPMPRWVGLPATMIALLTTVRMWRVTRSWRRHRGTSGARLRVVELDRPIAYAETGRHGGVVVSTGMLAVLAPDERRALLVHEESHLKHRHDRFLVVGSLAAGFLPLAPAVRQLRQALERWADEEAAVAVGDRTVVARAVARAALASHQQSQFPLSMQGANVPARVEALLQPPVGGSVTSTWTAAAVAILSTAAVAASIQLHHLAAIVAVLCLA